MKLLTLFLFFSVTLTTPPLFGMTDEKTQVDAKKIDLAHSVDETIVRQLLAPAKIAYDSIPTTEWVVDKLTERAAFLKELLQCIDKCFTYAHDNKLDIEIMTQSVAEIIKDLKLELGYSINWEKILLQSAEDGNVNTVKTLCLTGAKLDSVNYDQATPLHLAAQYGHDNTCKVLLDFKAPVKAQDRFNRTPLHYAAKAGHKQICLTLMAAGADRKAQDWCGGGINRRGYPEDYATGETLEAFKE